MKYKYYWNYKIEWEHRRLNVHTQYCKVIQVRSLSLIMFQINNRYFPNENENVTFGLSVHSFTYFKCRTKSYLLLIIRWFKFWISFLNVLKEDFSKIWLQIWRTQHLSYVILSWKWYFLYQGSLEINLKSVMKPNTTL